MTYINGNTREVINLDGPVEVCEVHDIKHLNGCPNCLIEEAMQPSFVSELREAYDINEFATAANSFITCGEHGTKFPEGFTCVPCGMEDEYSPCPDCGSRKACDCPAF